MRHILLAIFDQAEHLNLDIKFPSYLDRFLLHERDFKGALAFLYAYKDIPATYNAYRREVEKLLHWSWQVNKKSIFDLHRIDIEAFIKFCQSPLKSWISTSKCRRFLNKHGERTPNKEWRPFVATISKAAAKKGETPKAEDYVLSEQAIMASFAIIGSFYTFLIQEGCTEINPVVQIKQKSKFITKSQTQTPVRRLNDLQWSFVIETAKLLAKADPKHHERTLFIMSALYSMYLRVSELTETDYCKPKMNSFKLDNSGNWWFYTIGKGRKSRQIAVSDAMLEALKAWRKHLGLKPALPTPDDASPLLPRIKRKGGITSANQIRSIVQYCFDQAVERMIEEGFTEQAEGLEAATVHWLRHTGISDDVKHRSKEHVRDDAGHSSGLITDRYIDSDIEERHRSARKKVIDKDT